MFWFKKPPVIPEDPKRIEIVHRETWDLTPDEWRKDPGLVSSARKALNDPVIRNMIATLRNDHYGRFLTDARLPVEVRVAHADRAAGFGIALETLECLGKPLKSQEPVPSTFSKDNWETPTEKQQ